MLKYKKERDDIMKNIVITIGRQFGSGGSAIGKALAEELGISYYDKNIIEIAAEKSGIREQLFKDADEKHNSFLYSLSMAHYSGIASPAYLNDVITNDKLFVIQSNVIKDIAQKESCIFVGRCASDILSETCKTFNIFIHAPYQTRVERIMRVYDIPEANAKSLIKKTDKSRASYYNFYSNGKWGNSDSYNLSIDSSLFGIDGTVKILKELILNYYK